MHGKKLGTYILESGGLRGGVKYGQLSKGICQQPSLSNFPTSHREEVEIPSTIVGVK